ncbi:MAG: hypothetical protein AAF591_17765 [Verrucomicrobiota bacterium]
MKTPLPPILENKLADYRRRVWVVKLAEGILAALFGIALSYVLVFVLDRFIETPGWLRGVIMFAGAAVLGFGLPLKWHRWVWRQRRLEDAARLMRRKFPRLGDQLLGIVELAAMESGESGRSERLVEAAMEQAAEAAKDKDFAEAIPDARHHRWAWAVGGVLILAGVAIFVVPDAARNALARWVMPWEEVERFTFARHERLPERVVVPYAEPFEVPVQLAEDTRWMPGRAKARLSGQNAVMADRDGEAYRLDFPPQKEGERLSLRVGDALQQVDLEPMVRPELTALAVQLRLPKYLRYETEPEIEVRGGSVSLLGGAEASIVATASRELARAELNGAEQSVDGPTLRTEFQQVEEDEEVRLNWTDELGLSPRDELVLRVRAVEDEAPKIVARRESLEQVVLETDVVTFDLSVADDFGVKRTGLEWRGTGEDSVRGEKIAGAGGPEEREMAVRATFSAQREGVEPQVLEIRAWADDYLPKRERSYSSAFMIRVLNKTDHALWLTEQFGKWLQVARESYEREQQLHETNKELRALSAADLDRPEVRRRVSQQAAAEDANAARLSGLTASGRNLVEQATRNDEFDATRLESWATMLQALDEIAAERMPSVADLLKETAGAPGGKAQQASSGAPSGESTEHDGKPGGERPQEGGKGQPAGPRIGEGPPIPGGPGAAPKAGEDEGQQPVPGIADGEKSLGDEGRDLAKADVPPKRPSPGALRLPQTTLGPGPGGDKGESEPGAPESPAQESLETAVVEQRDLLAEFARVSDQLNEILASLEASTFVKRFKAASREQLAIAKDLNAKTMTAFGLRKKPVPVAATIAEKAESESEVVRVIQSDMEAYFQRRPDMHFKNVLGQMKKMEVVRGIARVGSNTEVNLSGYGLAGAEFWADTMDRWAEEMVAASECESSSSCSADSLPPEIVLKVMQALRDEIALRDETRELEQARGAMKEARYEKRALPLAKTQREIRTHTLGAINDILDLPQGNEKFGKELRLLKVVTEVMGEAYGILKQPDTGAPAIAAETEVIELLLQARRMNPGGGGGGGASPGGGGGGDTRSQAALAGLGPGSDADARVGARNVGQATGKAGREFPEEFKAGLDAYFNALEEEGAAR